MQNRLSYNIPGELEIDYFRKILIGWFKKNSRKYPWRETDDPFRFLVAEIMLRRTKADQVKGVYIDLFNKYPDLSSILKSNEKDINKILYPLGLNWRFSLIKSLAREIIERYNGSVPVTREELKRLPGIGDYSAGALLSIIYGKKEWMVDNNIVRLFKRYFGLKTSTEGRRDYHIIELSKKYISSGNPRNNNLALLDFAALICKPFKPECRICKLNKTCMYFSKI